MSRRRLRRAGAAVVAAATIALTGAGAARAQGGPTATVEPSAARPGAPVIVRASGFEPGTLVSVEVCGNEARRGSADCDQSTSLDAGVNASGEVAVQLIVGTPPVPCPCVVKVSGLSSSVTTTAPITVVGAPVADANALAAQFPDVQRQLAVHDAHFEGSAGWTSWFGASARRELVYTVQNTGTVAVQDPPVIMAFGKGASPTGIVHPPPIGTLQPGESRTYRAEVSAGPFAFGSYSAVGQIPGFADPVAFSAGTTTYPWGLIIIALVAVFEFVVIKARNRVRARVAPLAEVGPAIAGPVPALNPGPVPATAAVGADQPTAMASLSDEALENAIVAVLTETLRSVRERLGDRTLSEDEVVALSGALAREVTDAVGATLHLAEDDQAVLAGHLEGELLGALAGSDPRPRDLAGAGNGRS